MPEFIASVCSTQRMKINLIKDYPLRGVMFEHVARILLRRMNDNNFIFCSKYFDSVDEILTKYRLDSSKVLAVINHLRINGVHTDLIEFELFDINSRIIRKINFYEVKSRIFNSIRECSDICITGFEFLTDMNDMGCGTFVFNIFVNNRWCIEYDITDFILAKLRVYDSTANKTKFYFNQYS